VGEGAGPSQATGETQFLKCCLFITLMMEALHVSEMSAYFNETTRRYIPEGCDLDSQCCENVKSRRDQLVNAV
jgi:hypothetical protein